MNKEVCHARTQRYQRPPPRPPSPAAPILPNQLWLKLSDESRNRTLNRLSRVVVQQLTTEGHSQEVAHEQS